MEALQLAQAKALEIAVASGKDMLLKYNEMVLPLVLDAVKQAIPGMVDDAVIAVAQPIVQEQLKQLIEGIKVA